MNPGQIPQQRKPESRARHACARCRRQKLRCDNQRPCLLCIRSQNTCEEQAAKGRKPRRATTRAFTPESGRTIESTNAPIDVLSRSTSPPLDEPSRTTTELEKPPWDGPTSTFNLVKQVFKSHFSETCQTTDSDAIPDSSGPEALSRSSTESLKQVSALLGMELPPAETVQLLLSTFITSMHWYQSLFHEPTMWSRYHSVLQSGLATDAQTPFLLLLLMVLVTGARYVHSEDLERHALPLDLIQLQDEMIQSVEERLLLIFDRNTTESVTVLLLLSSHYLFNRRPSRAFIMIAAALRAAQAIGLYDEFFWGNVDPLERETRRRLWWTLYTADGFVAQIYGRPSLISVDDIHVKFPLDIDDNSERCPGFNSVELREDGSKRSVTVQSYHRYKAALYLLAAPITRDLYSHGKKTKSDIVKRVRDIHQQLLNWESKIPPELRLQSHPPRKINSADDSDRVLQIFRLQAMALQVSYDNIQLLLHRPLLDCVGKHHSPSNPQMRSDSRAAQDVATKSTSEIDMARLSKQQCWQSAMRTSLMSEEHWDILQAARTTPFGAHVGIHSFTAGVMLGIFALSNPLSNQVHEAKRGIARIIRVRSTPGYKAAVWTQSAGILEELLRLVLAEEMKRLVPGVLDNDSGSTAFKPTTETVRRREPQFLARRGSEGISFNTSNSDNLPFGHNNAGPSSPNSFEHDPDRRAHDRNLMPADNELGLSSLTDDELYNFMSMSPNSDFDSAFLSLQQVFSSTLPNGGFDIGEATPSSNLNYSTPIPAETQFNQNIAEPFIGMPARTSTAFYDSASRGFDSFDSGEQIWMWRPQSSLS